MDWDADSRPRPLRARDHAAPAADGPDGLRDHPDGDEDHRPAGAPIRPEPDRPARDVPEHDPRLQGAGEGGHRPRPGRSRHLHPRPVDGLHGGRHEHARHPVRARRGRGRLQHRHRLLLRGPRPLGGRAARRRLGELQQVLAARRAAQRGADGQLRDPADPVDRRRSRAWPARSASPSSSTGSSTTAGCCVWQPVGLAIFYVASLAEINRTPFDMVEADSRARGRALHRVLGHALRVLLLRRVRRPLHHERHPHHALLRRLPRSVALPGAARTGSPGPCTGSSGSS